MQIESSERERTRTLPPSDLRAYGFVLQGQQHIFRYRREENRLARQLYEAALEADPLYARALTAKSRTLNLDWRYDWAESSELPLDEALALALQGDGARRDAMRAASASSAMCISTARSTTRRSAPIDARACSIRTTPT